MTQKTKAHTPYHLRDGTRVPSVTTALGVLDKPGLIQWAWKLGREGIDWRKFRDEAADIGTLTHYLILCHLKGETPDIAEYSPHDVDKAENALLSYYEWEKGHKLEPILVEKPLVSEQYKYGGTIDCYCNLDGEPALLDFKTGKAIYPEHIYQLAAYTQLLREEGHPVSLCRILRIGRTEDESFEDRQIKDLRVPWDIFKHCLEIYKLKARRG
jgi:hypothetical protein